MKGATFCCWLFRLVVVFLHLIRIKVANTMPHLLPKQARHHSAATSNTESALTYDVRKGSIPIVQGDPKSFVPIFYLIKNPFFNGCLFCCRRWKVNLWMIAWSYSCPKNVLDKSAEYILPGGLFWVKRKFSSFSSTLQNHSHIATPFSLSVFALFGSCMGIGAKN
jgi:hypothetical protein